MVCPLLRSPASQGWLTLERATSSRSSNWCLVILKRSIARLISIKKLADMEKTSKEVAVSITKCMNTWLLVCK